MSYAPGLNKITDADIARAAANPDMNEALAPLAIISQVDSGDVAAQVFSNMSEDEWRAASVAEREAKIRDWIRVEWLYAKAEDEDADDYADILATLVKNDGACPSRCRRDRDRHGLRDGRGRNDTRGAGRQDHPADQLG